MYPFGTYPYSGKTAASAAAASDTDVLLLLLLLLLLLSFIQMRLDTPWLTQKLPLRSAPLCVAWFPDPKVIAIAAQRLAPYCPHLPVKPYEGGDPAAAAAYAAADAAARAAGCEEMCEVLVMVPPGSNIQPPVTGCVGGYMADRVPGGNIGGWVRPRWR
jgi:hypothetical protein